MKLFRSVLTAALALSALAIAPSRVDAADPLQPGDYHETSVGACTFNFVYDGPSRVTGTGVYLGTAAHCVDHVGEAVFDEAGTQVGQVALIGNQDATATDYAFVEVLPGQLSRVSPAVKGNTQYPTGVTTAADTQVGDLVQLSGYGIGFNFINVTQERRVAVMGDDDAEIYTVTGPIDFGDSGGPLVHVPTGRALGIVSRLCIGVCTEEGATVQGILAKAAGQGLALSLRTVQ